MDHEETQRELMRAARFPQPFEWLFQQGQTWEKVFVSWQHRARWLMPWVLAKMSLMFVGVGMTAWGSGWVVQVGIIVLIALSSLGIMGHVRRAQAYRNGWTDRGNHDVVEHELVCGDPIANDRFAMRMVALNSEVLL